MRLETPSTSLPRFQATLGAAFERSGKGLHTGREATVRVSPAEADHGVVFRRRVGGRTSDVPARWLNRRSRPLCTAVQVNNGPLVRTVEHLLAALMALRIDNALVEIDAEELPILDGSAAPWCEGILSAGRIELDAPRRYVRVLKRIDYAVDNNVQRIVPAKAPLVEASITLSHFGKLRWSGAVEPEAFLNELAPSRSFGRFGWAIAGKLVNLRPWGGKREREPLLRGATMKNTAALWGRTAIGGLRMPDEPVRHRALDLIGDFALAGKPVLGRITAVHPGHEHNFGLLQALMRDKRAWDLIEFDEDGSVLRVWDS